MGISTMKPKVDRKSLQDDVSGAKNVTSGIATRLCSAEDKPQKRTGMKIKPETAKTTQRVRINVKTRTGKRATRRPKKGGPRKASAASTKKSSHSKNKTVNSSKAGAKFDKRSRMK